MQRFSSKSIRIILLFIFGCVYMMAKYLFDFSPLVGWSILFSFILFVFFIEKVLADKPNFLGEVLGRK